jgi:hypothetical protein
VSGSSSTDEAVFVALADMLAPRIADPELRAAMFRTIGLVPAVSVHENATDAQGRRGIALTWTRDSDEGTVTQTLVIDPSTSTVLETRATHSYRTPQPPATVRGLSHVLTLLENDITDRVPADVLDKAETHS